MTKRRLLPLVSWAMVAGVVLTIIYGIVLLVFVLSHPSDLAGGHVTGTGFSVDVVPGNSVLRKGDVIVRIDGRALSDGIGTPGSWHEFLFNAERSGATYAVRRGGRLSELQVSWHVWPLPDLLLRIAPLLVVVLAFNAAVVLLLFNRTYDPAAGLIALALWVQGANLLNNMVTSFGANLTDSLAWFYAPLDLLTFSLGMSLFLHVLFVFPERTRLLTRFPRSVYLVYVVNIAIAVVAIIGVGRGTILQNRMAIFGRLLFPLAAIEVIAGLVHVVHTYLTLHRPGVRDQIRWVVWGVLLGSLPWLLLFNIPVFLTGRPLVPLAIASLPLILVPIAFFLSVTRRGLTAVDTLINRSIVYVIVTGILVGIYFAVVSVLSPLLAVVAGVYAAHIASFIAVFVIAILAVPLCAQCQRWVERVLYRRWYDLKRFLRAVGSRLSITMQLDALVPILEVEIPQHLHITCAALLVRRDDGGMQAVRASEPAFSPDHPLLAQVAGRDAPLVLSQLRDRGVFWANSDMRQWELLLPLRSEEKLQGLYLLGPRLSGDRYGQDEVKALAALAQQIAATLDNIQLYQQVEMYSQGLADMISERTRELAMSNQALSEERDRLDVIIQNMADGLFVVSRTAQIVLVNPAFEAMIGQPREDILDQPVGEALQCPAIAGIVEQAAEEPGVIFSGDCLLNDRILRASSVALRDESGTITVVRDVTHEVEVDRMKTEFISSISHELRTPLTSVLGFSKLIRKSLARDIAPVLPEDRKAQRVFYRALDNLDIVIVESERLAQLVNDVLDIAKMESGKIEWHDEWFDLGPIVQRAVDDVMPQVEHKGIALHVDLDSRVAGLVADPDRIHQVLFNLLSNAVKFTDEGDVTLSTRFVESDEMTARWAYPASNRAGMLVSVRDTGLGIPRDEIPQLFQRFKQVWEDSLTSKPQGTGLGLAISRGIIKHYGGYIWVESEVGCGSDFQFVLPLSAPSEVPAVGPDLPRATEIGRRADRGLSRAEAGAITVLVVDDDANVRSLLTQELTEAGYGVLEASNGIDALAAARRYRPSAIILDVMMPGLSGFDVVQLLKSDIATAVIPIIILSIIEDSDRGLVLGTDAYLTKPVDVEVLLDTLVGLISPMVRPQPDVMLPGTDQSALEQITRILRETGFQIVDAYDSRGAIATAQQTRPDMKVLDEMMASLDDVEVIKAMHFQQKMRAATIVIVAGHNDTTEDV